MTKHPFLAIAIAVALTGCTNLEPIANKNTDDARLRMEAISTNKPTNDLRGVDLRSVAHVRTHDTSYLGVTINPQLQDRSWINTKKVTVNVARNGMTVEQLISHLNAQGIKISARVPIAGMQYRGLGVADMDGETAVKILFGSIGLDVEFDVPNKTVVLKPLMTHTWFIGIANRKSSFRAGRSGSSAGSANTNTNNPNNTATGGLANMVMNDQGGGSIEVNSDFWAALKADITARLTVMLPRINTTPATPPQLLASLPPLPIPGANTASPTGAQGTAQQGAGPQAASQPAPGQPPAAVNTLPTAPALTSPPPGVGGNQNSGDPNANAPLEKLEMGNVSVNPETGAVSVQAPQWLIEDIQSYMKKVIDSANTTITFSGEILTVESSSSRSEGLDISMFAEFAKKKYGAFVQNNPLGGVTVSFPEVGSNIPSLSSNVALPGSGSMIGAKSAIDGLSIFNAYLSQFGTTRVIQRPVVATTSSVPGEFSRTTTRYYNNLQQQAASGGTGSASTATNNNLIPVQLGTLLRIVPLFNPVTRTVRAQMSLQQSVQTGIQREPQVITVGNSFQTVATDIPIISRMNYSGETVLRDGDLIVVGGMVEDSEDATNSGVRGTDGGPLAAITRQGNDRSIRNTYYVALRVAVEKKE